MKVHGFRNKNYSLILVMTILIIISLMGFCSIPRALALEELIKNGGFETGNFYGWNVDQICEIVKKDESLEDIFGNRISTSVHSGEYSARIGGPRREGILSQTIFIPKDSKIVISFWYTIQKGSSLDFYIIKIRGGTLKHWSFHEETDWKYFTYELEPEHSGEPIILKFRGIGNFESKETVVPITDWIGETLRIEIHHFYHYYYAFIDDVSVLVYKLKEDEVIVTSSTKNMISYKTESLKTESILKENYVVYALITIIISVIIIVRFGYYRVRFKEKSIKSQISHKNCPYCGKVLPPDAEYCSECGKKQK